MSARYVYLLLVIASLVYTLFLNYLQSLQRKKPLPTCVRDIYSKERYQTYLEYVAENKKMASIQLVVTGLIDLAFVFSNFYGWILSFNTNVYINFLIVMLIQTVISMPIEYLFEYIDTFKIEEKYGKNKHTFKSFNKDFFLMEIPNVALSSVLMLGLIYCFENLGRWTHGFNIDFQILMIIVMGLIILAGIIYGILGFVSLLLLKKQYVFKPLEDSNLINKINALMVDCKKKVKVINVYNESSKSTSKNAFLLKFLWIKEFGIADNFLDGNSEDELLAVLSHEIGHLKHKKNIWNYLNYLFPLIALGIFIYCLLNVEIIFSMNAWINTSFNLTSTSYPVLFLIYGTLFKPILFFFGLYRTIITRNEEYEADRNAVKEGFGKPLIQTFKQLSTDELVNVNPAPLVEFLEYDHPGMASRINAIEKAMKAL